MPEAKAIDLIVEGYVKLAAREALEDLRAHRCRLAEELKSIKTVLDLSLSIRQMEDDILAIDTGLAKLNSRAVEPVKVTQISITPS